jgi:hypothetical protein
MSAISTSARNTTSRFQPINISLQRSLIFIGKVTECVRVQSKDFERLADVRFGSLTEFFGARAMSALPPKADILGFGWNVRFVPIADIPVMSVSSPLYF